MNFYRIVGLLMFFSASVGVLGDKCFAQKPQVQGRPAKIAKAIETTQRAIAGRGFEVKYYPRAVYAGEVATWVLGLKAGSEIAVHLNGVQQGKFTAGKTDRVELNLTLDKPGVLRIEGKEHAREFRLLSPGESQGLKIRNHYLVDEKGLPVILLPAHRHPPKVDRRWQLGHWFAGLLDDTRPVVSSVEILAEMDLAKLSLASIFQTPPTLSFWSSLLPQLNRLDIKPKQAICLVIGSHDLNYGMSELALRMQIEWVLQVLAQRGLKHIYLAAIFDGADLRHYPSMQQQLNLAARGNGAKVIHLSADDLNVEALVSQLTKTIRVPALSPDSQLSPSASGSESGGAQ